MNLQVNLILDSEKRSGSAVSMKFAFRVLAVAIPVILGIVIMVLILGARVAKQNLQFAEQEKSQLDPVYKSVIGLKQELRGCQHLAEVLDGWNTARPDWFSLLSQFQMIVPPSIQLLRLTVNETIEKLDNVPTRSAGMYLKGRVMGDRAEDDVQLLDMTLKENKPFKEIFTRVDVKRFEAAEDVTDKTVRVFEIECIMTPKKICKPKLIPAPAQAP